MLGKAAFRHHGHEPYAIRFVRDMPDNIPVLVHVGAFHGDAADLYTYGCCAEIMWLDGMTMPSIYEVSGTDPILATVEGFSAPQMLDWSPALVSAVCAYKQEVSEETRKVAAMLLAMEEATGALYLANVRLFDLLSECKLDYGVAQRMLLRKIIEKVDAA